MAKVLALAVYKERAEDAIQTLTLVASVAKDRSIRPQISPPQISPSGSALRIGRGPRLGGRHNPPKR